MRRPAWSILLAVVAACLGDPVGPGVLMIATEGARPDTVWVGAPGEPLPSQIRLRVTDDAGRPLPAAPVTWQVEGRNASVLAPSPQTNAAGLATAGWLLGTDAAEEQQLHVWVRTSHHEREVVIRARAVPHIVSQIRVLIDTPSVVRLGDTLPVAVNAIDPYGNVFPAPDVTLSVTDSAIGTVAGQTLIAGPHRGLTSMRIASHGVEAAVPMRVTQYVAAIVPVADALRFSALGAQRQVAYVVRDDRGRAVADTTVTISVADSSVAQLTGEYVRAVAPGLTTLSLTLGPVAATIPVGIQQRVGSLGLTRDTIRLDALMDTTTVTPVVNDSLGSVIPDPVLEYSVSDPTVVKFAAHRTLEAVRPGAAIVTVTDTATGISTSAPVVVRQAIAQIDLTPAQISFDALGDTLTLRATALDRLGSVVAGAALSFSVSDERVAVQQSGSQLRSVAPGRTLVVVSDPETGIVATVDVQVEQRVAVLALTADSVVFDALGDTMPLAFTAWDRLGAVAASATVAYSTTDTSIVAADGDGVLRSRDNGTAFVIARSADGPLDSVRVSVAQRVEGIFVDRDSILFESLQAVQPVRATPIDRLGSPARSASVVYATEDSDVATVGTLGDTRAVGNGVTRIVATTDGYAVVTQIRVAQRAVRVNVPADTIRFQSLGDIVTLTGIAIDSLGSPVPGDVAGVTVDDTAVVAPVDSVTVSALVNGVTLASLTVAGVTRQVVLIVDQLPMALSATVTFGSPVITLPVGASLPLACQGFDANGHLILRDVSLVASLRGTVTGTGCADARVQRSGYDTLSFAMGSARASIPVIIATAPDSVGVIVAAQPLPDVARIRFTGEDLRHPSILALRPLVQEILAAYGNPSTNLGRARAIRDWLARTAVHPHPPLHPNGSTSNLSVLPPGSSWADVNALTALPSKDSMLGANVQYWSAVGYDGYAMLDRLLGTLDPVTGARTDDGMMVHLGWARYQIRDLHSYKYPICTFQAIMLNALWAAAGLQGMLISTIDHDPASVFIPDLNQWVYEDPTFNEEYLLDGTGDPLSPAQLLEHTSMGNAARLRASKFTAPSFDPQVYIATESYVREHPRGMVIMGSQLNSRVVGIGGWSTRLVQIDGPQLTTAPLPYSNPLSYVPVTALQAFPILGPVLDQLEAQDSVYIVHLSSTFPNADHIERRFGGGDWESVSSVDVLPIGQCNVEYRSADDLGNYSATARLDVWAPRAEEFLRLAAAGSTRSQSRYCVSGLD